MEQRPTVTENCTPTAEAQGCAPPPDGAVVLLRLRVEADTPQLAYSKEISG